MKLTIPENLQGKELIDFVVSKRDELLSQKKSFIKCTDIQMGVPSLLVTKGEGTKAINETGNPDSIMVKVVANTANWMDSDNDVLLPGAAKKSIRERKGMIPHLKDHNHTIEAQVGDVKNIYLQEVALYDLGLKMQGTAEALIFETEIKREYDDKIFQKYKQGKINQHSIGLQYVKIDLAVNDESYPAEKALWDKYIGQVINRKDAEATGYFFPVLEYKLLENSAVLFGSNVLTPTLETKSEPDGSTHEGEPHEEPTPEKFDVSAALKRIKIIQ